MFQKLSDLQTKSKTGIYLFWCKLLLAFLHIITFGFSIYGIIVTSKSIWKSIIGSGLLALSVITMLLSISAFVLILIGLIGINMKGKKIIFIIYIVIVVFDLIINYIILGNTTESEYLSDYVAIVEHCEQMLQTNKSTATELFCWDNPTTWSLKQYTRYRTLTLYDIFAGVSAPTTILIVAFIILVFLQPDAFDPKSPDSQPLDPQSNDPNAQNIADPENPDAQNQNDNNKAPKSQDNKANSPPPENPPKATANNANKEPQKDTKPEQNNTKPPAQNQNANPPPKQQQPPDEEPHEYEYEYIEEEDFEEEEDEFVPQ